MSVLDRIQVIPLGLTGLRADKGIDFSSSKIKISITDPRGRVACSSIVSEPLCYVRDIRMGRESEGDFCRAVHSSPEFRMDPALTQTMLAAHFLPRKHQEFYLSANEMKISDSFHVTIHIHNGSTYNPLSFVQLPVQDLRSKRIDTFQLRKLGLQNGASGESGYTLDEEHSYLWLQARLLPEVEEDVKTMYTAQTFNPPAAPKDQGQKLFWEEFLERFAGVTTCRSEDPATDSPDRDRHGNIVPQLSSLREDEDLKWEFKEISSTKASDRQNSSDSLHPTGFEHSGEMGDDAVTVYTKRTHDVAQELIRKHSASIKTKRVYDTAPRAQLVSTCQYEGPMTSGFEIAAVAADGMDDVATAYTRFDQEEEIARKFTTHIRELQEKDKQEKEAKEIRKLQMLMRRIEEANADRDGGLYTNDDATQIARTIQIKQALLFAAQQHQEKLEREAKKEAAELSEQYQEQQRKKERKVKATKGRKDKDRKSTRSYRNYDGFDLNEENTNVLENLNNDHFDNDINAFDPFKNPKNRSPTSVMDSEMLEFEYDNTVKASDSFSDYTDYTREYENDGSIEGEVSSGDETDAWTYVTSRSAMTTATLMTEMVLDEETDFETLKRILAGGALGIGNLLFFEDISYLPSSKVTRRLDQLAVEADARHFRTAHGNPFLTTDYTTTKAEALMSKALVEDFQKILEKSKQPSEAERFDAMLKSAKTRAYDSTGEEPEKTENESRSNVVKLKESARDSHHRSSRRGAHRGSSRRSTSPFSRSRSDSQSVGSYSARSRSPSVESSEHAMKPTKFRRSRSPGFVLSSIGHSRTPSNARSSNERSLSPIVSRSSSKGRSKSSSHARSSAERSRSPFFPRSSFGRSRSPSVGRSFSKVRSRSPSSEHGNEKSAFRLPKNMSIRRPSLFQKSQFEEEDDDEHRVVCFAETDEVFCVEGAFAQPKRPKSRLGLKAIFGRKKSTI